MPQSDPALDGVLAGVGAGGTRAAPLPPPRGDAALDEALRDLTPRGRAMVKMLVATEPESSTALKGAAEVAGGLGAGLLASKALTGLAGLAGVPAIGRFLTGAAGGVARLPSLAASGAWQGALQSGVNRLLGDETPMGQSAGLGAVVNALTGGIGHALFGHSIAPEAAQRALEVRAAGLPLATGNVPGASFAARLAGKVTGATRPDAQAFTKYLMKSVGSDADTLSGETLASAKARLQGDPGNLAAGIAPTPGEFDKIAQRAKPITWSSAPGIRSELADILAEAQNKYGLLQQPDEMRRVLGQVQNVTDALNAGGITGDQLQAITSSQSGLSALASGGTAGSYLGTRLKRALYNAAAQADPATAKDLSLARNQYRNIAMLESKVEQLTDANGLVDPQKLATRVRGTYGNYEKASEAAAASGQPVDLGALGTAGQRFGQQPVARPGLAGTVGLGAGAGVLGAEELLSGFPAYESLVHHPLLSLGASAGMLGGVLPIGAAQNSQLLTDLILSRASRGAGPLFGGINPLISAGVTAMRHPLAIPSRDASMPNTNWDNWLRGQSFLESPQGAPSRESSAKGYFQFLDGTAKEALAAGLPNPQVGSYSDQAAATRAYIERFYPHAASAIASGDYPSAVNALRSVWPSLPGGSQEQSAEQYAQWNKILGAQ